MESYMLWLLAVASLAGAGGPAAWPGPAVPGAEGFGVAAQGGTGGRTIWVTTLAPDGPGSLREALDAIGPRIVKFRVAGVIELERDVLIIGGPFRKQWMERTKAGEDPGPNPHSHVTVDGSSAPGPGITISGNMRISYGASHVVLRHLRIRDNGWVNRAGADCITVTDGCRHILIDHCSLTWGRDETVNFWGVCGDATLQWCIVTGYGPHGYNFLNGAGADRITLHHNLFAHGMSRSPRIGGNVGRIKGKTFPAPHPTIDVRNNVIYNWHNVSATSIDFGAHVNLVRNVYLPGRSSSPKRLYIRPGSMSALYLEGNRSPSRPSDDVDEWANAGHFGPAPTYAPIFGSWEQGLKADRPFPATPVRTQTPEVAKDLVLAQAGAWPRDAIDAGIVRTVLERTGDAGVKQALPADFENARPSASASAQGVGLTVRFQGKASDEDGEVASYSWDFGDGRVALGQNADHTYAKPGEYVVALAAMDDVGMTGVARLEVRVQQGRPAVVTPLESQPPGRFEPLKPLAEEPALVVTVPRVAAEHDEEGFPPASAWPAAPRLRPFLMQSNWREIPDREIDARVMHDGRSLLLKIAADIRAPQRVRPARRRTPERWGHDCFEIYLSPQWGREPWFHFVVHTHGAKYDAVGFDRDWTPKPDWRVRSRAEGKKWVIDVAIPLESMGLARVESAHSIGLKLCHYRAKDKILLWPAMQPGSVGRPHVVYSPDPTSYAKLQLP